MSGWIKVDRGILDWEWRSSPNHYTVFGYCLERANFTDQNFKGRVMPAGSFPTSHAEIAQKTGVTPRQVRSVLADLKKSGELVTKSSRQGTIITVVKWKKYQAGVMESVTKTGSNLSGTCQENVNEMSTIKKERKKEGKKERNTLVVSGRPTPEQIITVWNLVSLENNLKLPRAKALNPKRITAIKSSISEYEEMQKLDDWKNYFVKINGIPFLTGNNDRRWRADFDWVINKNNLLKVVEGRYDTLSKISNAEQKTETMLSMENPYSES